MPILQRKYIEPSGCIIKIISKTYPLFMVNLLDNSSYKYNMMCNCRNYKIGLLPKIKNKFIVVTYQISGKVLKWHKNEMKTFFSRRIVFIKLILKAKVSLTYIYIYTRTVLINKNKFAKSQEILLYGCQKRPTHIGKVAFVKLFSTIKLTKKY